MLTSAASQKNPDAKTPILQFPVTRLRSVDQTDKGRRVGAAAREPGSTTKETYMFRKRAPVIAAVMAIAVGGAAMLGAANESAKRKGKGQPVEQRASGYLYTI